MQIVRKAATRHALTYLRRHCFAGIVIGPMAKLQKASACASCRRVLPPSEARRARGWEGHFHPARLRGRRPRVPYSPDPLCTKRNATLSFLSPSLGPRMHLASMTGGFTILVICERHISSRYNRLGGSVSEIASE